MSTRQKILEALSAPPHVMRAVDLRAVAQQRDKTIEHALGVLRAKGLIYGARVGRMRFWALVENKRLVEDAVRHNQAIAADRMIEKRKREYIARKARGYTPPPKETLRVDPIGQVPSIWWLADRVAREVGVTA